MTEGRDRKPVQEFQERGPGPAAWRGIAEKLPTGHCGRGDRFSLPPVVLGQGDLGDVAWKAGLFQRRFCAPNQPGTSSATRVSGHTCCDKQLLTPKTGPKVS